MSVIGRIDRFQQRHRVIGFPLAVIYKFFDDQGNYLAALIAYYAFVSLFPLLLLSTSILGVVLVGHPHLQQRIVDTALHQIPVVGSELDSPRRLRGGTAGFVVGIVGAVYGGLGVAQAAQYAMNTAWSVPRNERPNPFKARGRSLLLLTSVGIGVIATTALSAIGAAGAGLFGSVSTTLVLIGSMVLNAAIFTLAFRLACARPLTVRQVLVGAIAAAVAWQALQTVGVHYVSHVRYASDTNGVFAIVLGLVAFLYVAAVAVVLCVEINVVLVGRLWPRALLTPFTDNVTLTRGDERTYTGAAQAQRHKGFETVEVTFDKTPPGEGTHEPDD